MMLHKLKCVICQKNFYGHKNKMYCSQGCKNEDRRKKRREVNKDKRRKKTNKKYYLKSKHILTKKYKLEQEDKERRKKEYDKIWKADNKVKNAEYRRKTKEKNRQWFDEYKKTLKCEFCGYNRCNGALDFHHKRIEDKKFHIGRGIGLRYDKERILKEIAKCFVLCSNCHRELHYKEEQEKIKKQREDYLRVINEPKKIYYNIVEEELNKDWFKDLQCRAKYNLARFGGNQYIKVDNGIKEKIDITKILSKKIGIGEKSVSRILQIYKRGTEEQKQRIRGGEDSINGIYKELKSMKR